MKTATFISGIAAGLILFTAAHAGINADPVGASFERDLNRVATPGTSNRTVNADPLHALVNVALWKANTDQVMASFERDLNRVATPGTARHSIDADPLHVLVNAALWNTAPATATLASASRNDNKVISD